MFRRPAATKADRALAMLKKGMGGYSTDPYVQAIRNAPVKKNNNLPGPGEMTLTFLENMLDDRQSPQKSYEDGFRAGGGQAGPRPLPGYLPEGAPPMLFEGNNGQHLGQISNPGLHLGQDGAPGLLMTDQIPVGRPLATRPAIYPPAPRIMQGDPRYTWTPPRPTYNDGSVPRIPPQIVVPARRNGY